MWSGRVHRTSPVGAGDGTVMAMHARSMNPGLPASRRDDHDNIVVMHGVTWAQYESVLEIRGERSTPRICYLAGELELMSPGRNHERIKSLFGRLLEAWAEEAGVELNAYGSWTVKQQPDERGVEPDECYVVGERETTAPDLAIEVVWTSGGINKLDIYAPLGVGEVWTWKAGRLAVHVLRGRAYVASTRSEVLPGLDLDLLVSFVERTDQTAAVREYRRALRDGR
jgi:Uma2 family endonuclease